MSDKKTAIDNQKTDKKNTEKEIKENDKEKDISE